MRLRTIFIFLTIGLLGERASADEAFLVYGDELVQFDLETGTDLALGTLPRPVDALAFAPDGTLYGIDLEADRLVEISTENASVVEVGALGLPSSFGDAALSFYGDQLLLAATFSLAVSLNFIDVFEVSPTDGSATDLGIRLGLDYPTALGLTALDGGLYLDLPTEGLSFFDPTVPSTTALGPAFVGCNGPLALSTGGHDTIWALRRGNDSCTGSSVPWRLDELDPATGAVISTHDGDPIHVDPPVAMAVRRRGALDVPTLGHAGIGAMMIAMMLVAGTILRRRAA